MKRQPRAAQTPTGHASIEVRLLRPFAVTVDGTTMPAHAWRLRHPRQLFQMLCLRSGHRMHRDEVVECLWPRSDAQAAANRLYHTIHALRSEFAKAGLDEREPLLMFEAGSLWLNPHHRMEIDAERLDALVAECRRVGAEGEVAGALLECAAALFETPELGGLANAASFEPRRGEIRDHCVWVLERLAAHHRDHGRHDAAIRVLQRLVAYQPSNEVAHRALMQLFDASHQPERALLQYTACQRFVQRDLAAEPSAQTQALRIAIAERSAAASKQGGSGGPPAPARQQASMPARAPLLGRSAELDELRRWLRDRRCRFVTIAAPAGTGKTSVALALGDSLHDSYRDGVLVVMLTGLADPAALEQWICRAAGLAAGVAEPGELLRRHFDGKQLLLVLDRFEHLVDAALRVSALIDSAPGLQVIVTSQCSLNCQAERVFDLCQLGHASMPAAVELFVRTALDAGAAEHQLADGERIAQLCARLGGNALAIQLAAAQSGCGWPSIDAPSREQVPGAAVLEGAEPEPQHRDLRAAIAWSLSLLRGEARAVLHGLTVFEVGFTIEDAQAVLQDVFGVAATRDALKALLEQRLVCRDPTPVGACAPGRFVLLDSIRQVLLERIEDRVAWAAVEASHAQRFGARTREAFELLRAGQVPAALALFEPHECDALGALDWCWAQGDLAVYLQACLQTCTLQMQRGGIVEVGQRLRHAVEQPVHGLEQRRHSAWCCYLLSRQLDYVADTAGSLRMLRASRQRSIGVDDDLLLDRIGTQLATIRASQLRLRAADMHIANVIRLSERTGVPQRLSKALLVRGGILGMGGHYASALNAAQAGFDTALEADDPQLAWWAHVLMADLALRSGQLVRARSHRDECIVMERLGFFRGVPLLSLKILYASLHFELEEHDAAQACLGQARAECHATESPHALAIDICSEFVKMETGRSAEVVILLSVDDTLFPPCAEFGEIYMQLQCYRVRLQSRRGESASATRSLASALMPIRRSHNRLWASWLASALADVAVDRGQPELAQLLLDRAATLQRNAGICASPRQLTSWRQVRDLAGSVPRQARALPWALAEAASIAVVADALEAVARSLFAAAAPQTRQSRVPRRAHAAG